MTGCPWSGFEQSPPAFCEQALCAWIREPGNTWSNLGFILVAWVMYRQTRAPALRHLRLLAHITLATGLGSAIYHATGTRWGELADYVGMHLDGAFMLTVCIRRWTGWKGIRSRVLFWSLFLSAFVPGAFSSSLLRPFYAFDGALCIAMEISLYFSPTRRARDYRWLAATWAFFLPAMALWYVDVNGLWCDPDRHWISGHALWHLFNALGFYAGYRYYWQFDALRDSRGITEAEEPVPRAGAPRGSSPPAR